MVPIGQQLYLLTKPADTTQGTLFYNNNGVVEKLPFNLDITQSVCDIAFVSATRFVLITSTYEAIYTYDFDGYTCTRLNTTTSLGNVQLPTVTAMSETRIAVFDRAFDELQCYDWDGDDWVLTGNPLSITSSLRYGLTALSGSRVALFNDNTNQLLTYDFDGTDWTTVGNALSVSESNCTITAMTSTRIALLGETFDQLRVYDFDGTDWVKVGTDKTMGSQIQPSMSAVSSNSIYVLDASQDKVRYLEFNGSTWDETATPYAFPQGSYCGMCTIPVSGTISGVVSNGGTPVEGALVKAYAQSNNFPLVPVLTDSDGRYIFNNTILDSDFHVTVEYENGGTKYNAPSLWDVTPV